MTALARTRGQRQRMTASQYREKAVEATNLALAATLDRVRERHEHAAATWINLASLSETLLARQQMVAPARQPADLILESEGKSHGQGPEAIEPRSSQT